MASHPEDRGSSGNAVLQYINGLDYVESQELSRTAYGDAHEAMNTFIHRSSHMLVVQMAHSVESRATDCFCCLTGYWAAAAAA